MMMREPEEIFGAVARLTPVLPDCFDLPASIEVIAIICFVSG
jgi:hypothetical protein